MPQIFHPSTNTIAKASIFGFVFIAAGLAWAASAWYRSPYVTEVNVAKEQPVMFSHEHHVNGLGIDCRYCHTSVEESSFAGIPSTKTCMSCHSQIWTNAEMLKPVRDSWRDKTPLVWNRVHDLPDYAYFNHSIHIAKGVGCSTCHGRVDLMPLTWKAQTLHMRWCLECHREPEKFIRPREEVFNMNYLPKKPQEILGPELVEKYHIPGRRITNCSTCHR
jgi:hypothetical protein